MSQDLLFEIGVEELPASYIQPALDQMQAQTGAFLEEQRLEHGAIRVEGTPRRLALLVSGLAERQEDRSEEVMGPSAKAAFGPEGQPTQVALGFARGKGVEVQNLVVKGTPKGDYVFARTQQAGRFTVDLLEEWLPKLPPKLNFPKSMRWGEGGPLRFARPISWLCALYGGRVLKFSLEHIESGAATRGHRFLAPAPIRLKDASHYEDKLAAAHVVLSMAARRSALLSLLVKAADGHGHLVADPGLLDVVSNLLEKPFVLAGAFDPAYLVLPKAVIITVLREHQFAFAVEKPDKTLAPVFLATTNGIERNLASIREGNARVVRARLEDAKFFFTEDRKTTLESRRAELGAVVWHEKLGTVLERVERLESLAVWVAERLAPQAKVDAARAARLCKSDLVTLMVGEKEFAGLQGEMGAVYAELDGESPAVAQAIGGHYRPRFAGDAPPQGAVGRCVALADKMDELVGCFGIGLMPTGSQDPYALRRKASGVVTLLKTEGAALSLADFAEAAMHLYPQGRLLTPPRELAAHLGEFFRARLETALAEAGYESSLVAAVAASRGPWVGEAFQRAEALRGLMGNDDFAPAVQAFSRVINILDKAGETGAVRRELLAEGAERTLWERYLAVRPVVERYCARGEFARAFEALAGLRGSIDAFFNDVLVMAEDPDVRANRLALLAEMARTIGLIADFRKLVKR